MSQLQVIRRHTRTRSRFEMPPSVSTGFLSQKRPTRDSAYPDAESFCRVADVRRESLRGMFVPIETASSKVATAAVKFTRNSRQPTRRRAACLSERITIPREEKRTQGLARATQGDGPRHPPNSPALRFEIDESRFHVIAYTRSAPHVASLRARNGAQLRRGSIEPNNPTDAKDATMLIISLHFTRVDTPIGRVNDATVRVAICTYIRHTWSRIALHLQDARSIVSSDVGSIIGRRERRNEKSRVSRNLDLASLTISRPDGEPSPSTLTAYTRFNRAESRDESARVV